MAANFATLAYIAATPNSFGAVSVRKSPASLASVMQFRQGRVDESSLLIRWVGPTAPRQIIGLPTASVNTSPSADWYPQRGERKT